MHSNNETVKYYSNRFLHGLLVVMMAGVIYIVLTKDLLEDLTVFASFFITGMCVVAVFFGLVSLYRMVDPSPVVVMSKNGILVKRFVFFKEFIPWSEITTVHEQQYKNRVGSEIGRVRVTTTLLRINRPNRRPVSINLTLLNKRGQSFYRDLEKHLAS